MAPPNKGEKWETHGRLGRPPNSPKRGDAKENTNNNELKRSTDKNTYDVLEATPENAFQKAFEVSEKQQDRVAFLAATVQR